MNICLVSREFPPVGGGIATYVDLMSRLLAEAGHAVHVLTAETGDAPAEERRGRIWIHRLPFVTVVNNRWLLDARLAGRGLRHLAERRDLAQVFAWGVAERLRTLIPEHGIELVEGPEYEAPLYLAQIQKIMDPAYPQTPCVVFLHSASYVILECNRTDVYTPLMVHRRHYETLTVQMADAVVSPSRVVAARMEADCGLAPGAVRVIRLPVDGPPPAAPDAPPVLPARDPDRLLAVGTLCYLKGTDLAYEGARRRRAAGHAALRLRMIGQSPPNDTTGECIAETLRDGTPPAERDFAAFLPPRPRAALWSEYATAAALLCPARWENFPYVVTEAMACGCPIIGSRHTGIAEIVEDGVQGILVEASEAGVEDGLRRFFDLTPEARAAMGAAARARAATLTDPGAVIRARVAHYAETVQAAGTAPVRLPAALYGTASPTGERRPARAASATPVTPDVVMVCQDDGRPLQAALASVWSSESPPSRVVVVDNGSRAPETLAVLAELEREGRVRVLRQARRSLGAARNLGWRSSPGDVLIFVEADDRLEPDWTVRAAAALDRFEDAAAVGCWVQLEGESRDIWSPPLPTLPQALIENPVAGPLAVRRAALETLGGFDEDLWYGYETWDLGIRLLAAGRPILLWPDPLVRLHQHIGARARRVTPARHGDMRRRMLAAHPELVTRHALELVLTLEQFYVHSRSVQRVEWSEATARLQALLAAGWEGRRRPLALLRQLPWLTRDIWQTTRRLRPKPQGPDARVERI